MGTDSVADPSHKGSGVFGLPVPFQKTADLIVVAHEHEIQAVCTIVFEQQA
jgi:hypothetical protein